MLLCSAATGKGITEIWDCVLRHEQFQMEKGLRVEIRREQALAAMRQIISYELELAFRHDPHIAAKLPQIEAQVRDGRVTSFAGARALLAEFRYPRSRK